MRSIWLFASLAVTTCFPSSASHAEPVALTHARVIDGTGAEARIDMTIVIDRGQILSIGQAPVAGARIIDLQGKTVMPALISDHSHVGLVEGMSTASRNYTRTIILAALEQYRRYGVLTVTALGLNKSPLFDQLRREQHQGINPGADLFGVDQGIGAPGGMPPEAWLRIWDMIRSFGPILRRKLVRLLIVWPTRVQIWSRSGWTICI